MDNTCRKVVLADLTAFSNGEYHYCSVKINLPGIK